MGERVGVGVGGSVRDRCRERWREWFVYSAGGEVRARARVSVVWWERVGLRGVVVSCVRVRLDGRLKG